MNPVNIMFIYFFATKTAENYNLSNPDELKNKALLTSMFSSNLGLSALLTDYFAKNMKKNIEVASSSPVGVIQPQPPVINSGSSNPVRRVQSKKGKNYQQQQSEQQSEGKETAY